ncbi:hypothetical protein SBOR_4525 [Sclerotinia borealis F-4128]|uniref:Uncharacterized protein n=1 Tax=Sclerotinia borealis (strain F-4128) TaxID=1432307 RepID=W9CKK6_SCLBF|nr:hypothetical protein SBOR_4525 [Sclerotinia borealis F-4128]
MRSSLPAGFRRDWSDLPARSRHERFGPLAASVQGMPMLNSGFLNDEYPMKSPAIAKDDEIICEHCGKWRPENASAVVGVWFLEHMKTNPACSIAYRDGTIPKLDPVPTSPQYIPPTENQQPQTQVDQTYVDARHSQQPLAYQPQMFFDPRVLQQPSAQQLQPQPYQTYQTLHRPQQPQPPTYQTTYPAPQPQYQDYAAYDTSLPPNQMTNASDSSQWCSNPYNNNYEEFVDYSPRPEPQPSTATSGAWQSSAGQPGLRIIPRSALPRMSNSQESRDRRWAR